MAQVLIPTLNTTGVGLNTGTGVFILLPGAGFLTTSGTESSRQVKWQSPGVLSNLSVIVTVGATAVTTVVSRITASNGNLTLSIPTTTTGTYTDAVNTDNIVAGNLLATKFSGTSSLTIISVNYLFAATTNTAARYYAGNTGSTNQTKYVALAGTAGQTTESQTQIKAPAAGTLKYLTAFSVNNSSTGATTIQSRVNTANGNLTISIGIGATGQFADNTNSDTVSVGDLIDFSVTTTGTGTANFNVGADWLSTNSAIPIMSVNEALLTLTASSTRYAPVAGTLSSNATEANAQITPLAAFTASMLGAGNSTAPTANVTVRFRINSANGNQNLSIGSGTTGFYQDAVNSDSVLATDLITYSFVTGATTQAKLSYVGVLGTFGGSPPPPTVNSNFLIFM